jgi:hypothetical protein
LHYLTIFRARHLRLLAHFHRHPVRRHSTLLQKQVIHHALAVCPESLPQLGSAIQIVLHRLLCELHVFGRKSFEFDLHQRFIDPEERLSLLAEVLSLCYVPIQRVSRKSQVLLVLPGSEFRLKPRPKSLKHHTSHLENVLRVEPNKHLFALFMLCEGPSVCKRGVLTKSLNHLLVAPLCGVVMHLM